MNLRHTLKLLLITLSALYLSGCGNANEATNTAAGHGNHAGGGTSTGGGTTTTTDSTSVIVSVQATKGMLTASLEQNILNLLLPQPAYAINDSQSVNDAQITVVQVDSDGNPVFGGLISPSDYSVTLNADDSYTIKMLKMTSLPTRVDLVIEAKLKNGNVLRMPLPNTAQDGQKPHVISVESEYAMRQFFTKIDADTFATILPCTSTTTTCNNHYSAAYVNWIALFSAISGFDISVPADATVDQALQQLAANVPFANLVDRMIDTVVADKITGSILNTTNVTARNYNVVGFDLLQDQQLDSNGNATGVVRGSDVSKELETGTAPDISYAYSEMVWTDLPLGLNDSVLSYLSGEIPITSNKVLFAANGSLTPQASNSKVDDVDSLVFNVLGNSLTTSGFLDTTLVPSQTVYDDNGLQVGRLEDPFLITLYDAKTYGAAFGAYYVEGARYELSGSAAPYTRVSKLEATHKFSFLASTQFADGSKDTAADDFSTSILAGNDYGVVSLSQRLTDGSVDPRIEVHGAIRKWTAVTTATLNESEPTAAVGDVDIFSDYKIGRDQSGTMFGVTNATDHATVTSRSFSALSSVLYDASRVKNNLSGNYDANTGRISFDSTDIGAADANGNIINLAINKADGTQGISHAVRLTGSAVSSLNGETFRLLGNGFALTSSSNSLFSLEGATLSFANGAATLTLKRFMSTEDQATRSVAPLTSETLDTMNSTSLSYNQGTIRNAIKMEFSDSSATSLTLEGFIGVPPSGATDGGDHYMVLRMVYGDSIGLVYALREKPAS